MQGLYVSARATEEQLRAEQMRRQAVLTSGYSFIVLQLIDRRKARASGVEVILPRRTESTEAPGTYEFTFDLGTGPLVFEPDQNRAGIMTAYLLDSDYNRALLGTHFNLNWWRIVDVISGHREDATQITVREVVEDVKKRSESVKSAAVMKRPSGKRYAAIVTKDSIKDLPEAEIDARIEKLREEKDRRSKTKEETAKKPVRKVAPLPEEVPEEEDALVVVK